MGHCQNNKTKNRSQRGNLWYLPPTILPTAHNCCQTAPHYCKFGGNPEATAPTPDQDDKVLGGERAAYLSKLTGQFILRRTAVINEKYLPAKVEQTVFCRMTPLQMDVYRQILSNSGFADACKAQALAIITTLKKLTNHPDLVYNYIRERPQVRVLDFYARLITFRALSICSVPCPSISVPYSLIAMHCLSTSVPYPSTSMPCTLPSAFMLRPLSWTPTRPSTPVPSAPLVESMFCSPIFHADFYAPTIDVHAVSIGFYAMSMKVCAMSIEFRALSVSCYGLSTSMPHLCPSISSAQVSVLHITSCCSQSDLQCPLSISCRSHLVSCCSPLLLRS